MSAAAASDNTVNLRLYAIGIPGSYANIATKWVAQIPNPVAMAAATIHIARALPAVARARLNKLTAVRLANRQTIAATATRRQSCSTVRQVRTRNISECTWPKSPGMVRVKNLCVVNRPAVRMDV